MDGSIKMQRRRNFLVGAAATAGVAAVVSRLDGWTEAPAADALALVGAQGRSARASWQLGFRGADSAEDAPFMPLESGRMPTKALPLRERAEVLLQTLVGGERLPPALKSLTVEVEMGAPVAFTAVHFSREQAASSPLRFEIPAAGIGLVVRTTWESGEEIAAPLQLRGDRLTRGSYVLALVPERDSGRPIEAAGLPHLRFSVEPMGQRQPIELPASVA